MLHKPLCIVDTCSLIYLSGMELARRSLHRWLFDEFEVVYSQFVWEAEIQPQLNKIDQNDRGLIQRKGSQRIWQMAAWQQYEQALFDPFSRLDQVGRCSKCGQAKLEERSVQVDLASDEDRGERHNCGVALDAVRCGEHRQVIYLTDDHKAIRKYVQPIFETFPLGCVWSSYDLMLYLFVRHQKRMTADEVKAAFRDLTAKAARVEGMKPETHAIWQQRLGAYTRKVERVAQVMTKLP